MYSVGFKVSSTIYEIASLKSVLSVDCVFAAKTKSPILDWTVEQFLNAYYIISSCLDVTELERHT